jgi:TIR domain
LLTYARSLSSTPIKYATCFLSYARAEQSFAEQLQTDLQANRVLCWSAPYDAVDETMDELIQYISESILIYDKLLLVISEHSETKTSYRALTVAVKEALGKEELANERKASSPILLPIHLDKTPQEMGGVWARRNQLAKRQRRDFTSWNDQNAYQKTFDQLLHDLKASIPSHQERK